MQVLIYFGVNLHFNANHWIKHLEFQINETKQFKGIIENSSRMVYKGMFKVVPILLGYSTFLVDFYVVMFFDVDVIIEMA